MENTNLLNHIGTGASYHVLSIEISTLNFSISAYYNVPQQILSGCSFFFAYMEACPVS